MDSLAQRENLAFQGLKGDKATPVQTDSLAPKGDPGIQGSQGSEGDPGPLWPDVFVVAPVPRFHSIPRFRRPSMPRLRWANGLSPIPRSCSYCLVTTPKMWRSRSMSPSSVLTD